MNRLLFCAAAAAMTFAGAGQALAAKPPAAKVLAAHGGAGIPPAVENQLWQRYRLRQAVIAYAKNRLGQQVGSGQCWDLVDDALRAAGADASGDGNYVFGTTTNLANVVPGDVLQFEGVTFRHTDPSGAWSEQDYPHHTAIVAAVNGRTITLLNQNVNGNMTVQYSTINLNDQKGGTITAYSPKLP